MNKSIISFNKSAGHPAELEDLSENAEAFEFIVVKMTFGN